MNKSDALNEIATQLLVSSEEAEKILDKAYSGGEYSDDSELGDWINLRFLPNCVFIDEIGYAKMCVDALKILSSTVASDYGSSRQRDMGQLWADMTRGYLGELACLQFFEKNGIIATLGHDAGNLSDFLPMDIHTIIDSDGSERIPKLNIGIKTTKWNGIWMDIPNDQFNHSHIHILVKVGAGRDHLFSFFKNLSVFRDKVLKKGVEVGSITSEESEVLFDRIPSFTQIPAYIVGFVVRDSNYSDLPYNGKIGRKNFTITEWNGAMLKGDLDRIRIKEGVVGKIKFEGIGDFAHDSGYLFNTGNLLWRKRDWDEFVFKNI